eukprot:7430636-Alexandrium_andersonii.AAC.1
MPVGHVGSAPTQAAGAAAPIGARSQLGPGEVASPALPPTAPTPQAGAEEEKVQQRKRLQRDREQRAED